MKKKYAVKEKNWFFSAIKQVKTAFPDVLIAADVALDPYTDHGHDGVLDASGDVANDDTVHILTQYASRLARAGTGLFDHAALSWLVPDLLAALLCCGPVLALEVGLGIST